MLDKSYAAKPGILCCQMKEKNLANDFYCCLVAVLCPSLLQPHGLQTASLLCSWDFPYKKTGVDCHFLLQGIFWTQGLNPCLQHWKADLLPLSYLGSPPSDLRSPKYQDSQHGVHEPFMKMVQHFCGHLCTACTLILVCGKFYHTILCVFRSRLFLY